MKCKYWRAPEFEFKGGCTCNGDIPDGWRSVKDELPKEPGEYVARMKYENHYDRIIVSYFDGNEFLTINVIEWYGSKIPAPPDRREG
jgi:hypothetical protein